MPFLPPNQQRQSTEGTYARQELVNRPIVFRFPFMTNIYVYKSRTREVAQLSQRDRATMPVYRQYVNFRSSVHCVENRLLASESATIKRETSCSHTTDTGQRY